MAAALAAACLSAGCASMTATPSNAQLTAADYGVKPVNYEGAIRRYFGETLKDPGSVEYQTITEPEQGWVQHWRGLCCGGMQRTFGWRVLATINAKNSYGGYVGFRTYQFVFRGEAIADVLEP